MSFFACFNSNVDLNNNEGCRDFCFKNPTSFNCEKPMLNYCNNPQNVSKSVCRDVCKSGDAAKCDLAAAEYCKNNLSDDVFCGCYDDNAKHSLPQDIKNLPQIKNSRAICFSSKCVSEGYIPKNTSALTDTCPKCFQSIDFGNLSSQKDLIISQINQTCGNETKSVEPPASLGAKSEKESEDDEQKKTMMIIILILVVCVILSVIFMAFNSK